jgi:hypothetical protein
MVESHSLYYPVSLDFLQAASTSIDVMCLVSKTAIKNTHLAEKFVEGTLKNIANFLVAITKEGGEVEDTENGALTIEILSKFNTLKEAVVTAFHGSVISSVTTKGKDLLVLAKILDAIASSYPKGLSKMTEGSEGLTDGITQIKEAYEK